MVDSRMETDIGKEPALRNFPLRGYTRLRGTKVTDGVKHH